MNNTSFLFKLSSFLLILILFGCEGGKSKSVSCSETASDHGPYANCEQPTNQCPNGQVLVDGQCQQAKGDCPTGQHEENGQCVVNALVCPAGQHIDNGLCVNDILNCPVGQHEEVGKCVVNAVACADGQQLQNGVCIDALLTLEIVNQSACWLPQNGATRLIIQYVARDAAGHAIDPVFNAANMPTAMTSEIYVNDAPVDVESILDRQSVLLKSDLALSLVLDSSYSMLTHTPPAFAPMKTAAVSILQESQDTWAKNDSAFHWEVSWFNEYIYRPALNNAGESWQIQDILNLPNPQAGAFTGMYKAIANMAAVHKQLYDEGVAAKPRDQHIMIVLSDGADNHSFFNNSESSVTGNLNQMLFWQGVGYPTTTLDSLQAPLAQVPNLKTLVIGFGDKIDNQELLSIAQYGNGQYFFGNNSASLSNLFNNVKKEFITMQTIGVEVPLPPDQYNFSLRTRHLATGAEDEGGFTIVVGENALPTCETESP